MSVAARMRPARHRSENSATKAAAARDGERDIGRPHCFNTRVPCLRVGGPAASRSGPLPGHGDCRRDQYSATATGTSVAAAVDRVAASSNPTSLDMADTTEVAEKVAPIPSREELERVEKFTREPFAPDPDALRPGTARRRALDAALAEIESGREVPSIEWRQQYSLLLGLERLLADDEPKLVDGTVLSAHQVDALSGTLTALIAEAERQNGNGAAGARRTCEDVEEDEDELEPTTTRTRTTTRTTRTRPRTTRTRPRGLGRLGRRPSERQRRARRGGAASRAAGGPRRGPPLLVRARDRRRQDRRRARLRRGLAHRRHADPHPPPQPRRPVPRRAARPRLLEPHLPAAAARPGPRRRPGDGRDLPVVRAQRGQRLGRVHDRDLRRGPHRAGREDQRVDPPLAGPGLRRHDGDRRADRAARHRPLPDADQPLRPCAGRPPRRDRTAALRAHTAGQRRAHARQGAAAKGRGRPGLRPGGAGRAARPGAVQRRGRRPLPRALQAPARHRLQRRASSTPTTSRRRSRTPA